MLVLMDRKLIIPPFVLCQGVKIVIHDGLHFSRNVWCTRSMKTNYSSICTRLRSKNCYTWWTSLWTEYVMDMFKRYVSLFNSTTQVMLYIFCENCICIYGSIDVTWHIITCRKSDQLALSTNSQPNLWWDMFV